MNLVVDVDHVLADLRELAELTGGPDGARRLAWSEDWLRAREFLLGKLGELPVTIDRDEAGNIWAQLDGANDDDAFVIVGSHVDAVPEGGWLDGALGVFAAVGVLRAIAAAGSPPPVTVRLVDWADEEGARFGRSLLGSSAVARTLDPDEVRDLRDASGKRLQEALADCDVDLDEAHKAANRLDGAQAYLELHIEQGPVLLDTGRLASAVSGTFGDERYLITFRGQAAHAGSTPMHLRRDTLAAAATAALEIRDVGIRHNGVTTVGSMRSEPGVITAIAGVTEMMLDLRHLDADTLATMLSECLAACEKAAEQYDCTVEPVRIFGATPTPFHPQLVQAAIDAVAEAGGNRFPPTPAIPSGPLHDATEIGRHVPTVMVFAQSDPPLSHTNIEDSPTQALRVAIEAYGRTVGKTLELVASGGLERMG
jgi:N-carbamoyl-L-amino-acid hydrolase